MFQNLFVIFCRFATACGILDDDCSVAFAHHREGFFNENHSIARRRIRRIQDKSICRELFIGFVKTIMTIEFFQGVLVQDIIALLTKAVTPLQQVYNRHRR